LSTVFVSSSAALAAWFSLLPVANDAPTLPLPVQSARAGVAPPQSASAMQKWEMRVVDIKGSLPGSR
jgi:hypothetical protein